MAGVTAVPSAGIPATDGGHVDEAVAALAAWEYECPGDEYPRAAGCVLADPRSDPDQFGPNENGWTGQGFQYHVVAAIAYRVAGRSQRTTRRAVEAATVAREF